MEVILLAFLFGVHSYSYRVIIYSIHIIRNTKCLCNNIHQGQSSWNLKCWRATREQDLLILHFTYTAELISFLFSSTLTQTPSCPPGCLVEVCWDLRKTYMQEIESLLCDSLFPPGHVHIFGHCEWSCRTRLGSPLTSNMKESLLHCLELEGATACYNKTSQKSCHLTTHFLIPPKACQARWDELYTVTFFVHDASLKHKTHSTREKCSRYFHVCLLKIHFIKNSSLELFPFPYMNVILTCL